MLRKDPRKIIIADTIAKGRIVENLNRALIEIDQAQKLSGPAGWSDELTLSKQLSVIKFDLASCMDQILADLHYLEVH
jgi:hypothetical protein